uniref:MPN domain-containing protein n=1 Tax=Arcella intermedia TaxID=1963864 RepID=A0A6B2LVH1_9EUKA
MIEVSSAVVCTLMSHALTTEKEEVMGLLYGTVVDEVAKICSVQILQRQDKRKDRVEVSDHQLVQATQYAEHLGKNVRVIGWYMNWV